MVGGAGDDDHVEITLAPDTIIWLDTQETDVDDLVVRSASNWQLRALDHIEASAPPIVDMGHWSLNPQAVRLPL
jgi:hypothetical protein